MTGTGHDLQHSLEETLHEIEEHIPLHLRRWWRWSAIAVASVVVPIFVGLLAFRVIAPQVPGYKAVVEQRASAVIGFPVAIDDMYLSWYWFGPEVVMRKVRVLAVDREGELFKAAAVRVAISPLDFLRGGDWRPSRVVFRQPVIALTITPDQRLLLGGTAVGDLTQPTADWRAALQKLLTHGRIEAQGLALTWLDQRRLDGPLAFAGDIALSTDGGAHALELDLTLPAMIGKRLHIEGAAVGAPGLPEDWRWDAALDAQGIEVGWLRTRWDASDAGGVDGEVDIQAAVGATGSALDSIEGRVRMGDLRSARTARTPGESIDALESSVDWHRVAGGWDLDLQRLQVRRGTRVWQPGGIKLGYTRDDSGSATLSGEAGFLRVEDLALIASWLPTRVLPAAERLQDLAPRGGVTGLRFAFTLLEGSLRDYQVRAEFQDLGFDADGRVPGASGLSGRLDLRSDGGTLTLDSRAVTLDLANLFRAPLAFDALGLRLAWSHGPAGWELKGEDLRLRNRDVRASGRVTLLLPEVGGAPIIDLQLTAEDAIADNIKAYIPAKVMAEPLVHWLEHAIVAGRAPHAEVLMQGPLDHYPFKDGSGLFQVKFHAEDAVLDYEAGWPRVEGIVADVTFRDGGLDIVTSHATVGEAVAHQAHAWIPDLALPVVHIEGHLAATAEQGAWFIANSPLKEHLGAYLDSVHVTGPMDVGLAIELPVHDPAAIQVDVRTAFAGARVAVAGFPLVAEEVAGEVLFTQTTMAAEGLTGRLFGMPFKARIAPPPKGVVALARLSLDGGAEIRTVARDLEIPLERFMTGATALHGDLDIPQRAGEPLLVTLKSELKGVAVDLPAPFGKAAPTTMPVRANLRFLGDQLTSRIEYVGGSSASYALQREKRRGREGWAMAPGETAAHVTVVAPLVDLDAWLGEWSSALERTEARGPVRRAVRAAVASEPPLRRLDVRAKKLLFVGSLAEDATITARRDGKAWQVEVAGSTIAGSVSIPDDRATQPIVLDMERLWIAEGEGTGGAGGDAGRAAPDPRSMPAFEVRAASLRLAGADLGAVEATIEKRPSGLFLTRFSGKAPTHQVDGTGRWENVDGVIRTSLASKLLSTDARVTLAALGVGTPIEAETGKIESDVSWPGAPWQTPFARMDGKFKLRFGKGQVLELAPGAGRVVGLMSLNALPRRLKLDFSDVWKKGFYFDSIAGDFVIEQGNAFTDGAVIKGPAATVTIIGRTGLEARDYDQIAVVEGGLGSTLPVAGAIAGGLTGGAVMLLFAKVFQAPLEDATRARYHITGPWGAPKIETVSKEVTAPHAAGTTGSKP